MKKLIFISTIALSLALPTVSVAQQVEQQEQGDFLTQEEYIVITSVVCETSEELTESKVIAAIDSKAGSLSEEQKEKLQEIVIDIQSLPSEEIASLCEA